LAILFFSERSVSASWRFYSFLKGAFPPAGDFIPFRKERFRQLAILFLFERSVSASWRFHSFLKGAFPPTGGGRPLSFGFDMFIIVSRFKLLLFSIRKDTKKSAIAFIRQPIL
jgi:hypothetical protein